ncbi:hypothetical protein U14_04554 [Candidatus Moduliflexus flocculans]|uniref:Uncharacterized protein n=1 Tax=Candidatus Moduliflexus flocculans TaxID=1499966 RepID=A0A0S6W4I7_9BACT|nr:hypothetical protein U14_04554 [Candidatus Moduliflexus flocculans]
MMNGKFNLTFEEISIHHSLVSEAQDIRRSYRQIFMQGGCSMNTFSLKQMGIIGLNMIVFSCPALADA